MGAIIRGGGLTPGRSQGASWLTVKGVNEAMAALDTLSTAMHGALVPCLEEAGLYMEREIKLETRVDTGTLRASIGHYTPSDLTSKATSKNHNMATMAAIYTPPTSANLRVVVGTRIAYAPVVNYKYGDHMFEKGLQNTVSFLPTLVDQYIGAVRV